MNIPEQASQDGVNVQKDKVEENPIIALYSNMVSSDKITVQYEGVTEIRKSLSIDGNGQVINDVIKTGIVPKLVEIMTWSHDPKIQMESAWAVTNLCSGTSEHVDYIVKLGGIEILANLLHSDLQDIASQAVWAIGNISGDKSLYRDMCIKSGCIGGLITILAKFPDLGTTKKHVVWALSNIVRQKPIPSWNKVQDTLPVFAWAIAESADEEMITDAMWCLSYLSDIQIQEVINAGCIPHFIRHLASPFLSIQIPAMRSLGNIVTGDENQTNAVLFHPGFLESVLPLIEHQKKALRRETCWALSNIAAGTVQQIYHLLQCEPLMDRLAHMLRTDITEVAREVAYIFENLSKNSNQQQRAVLLERYQYLELLKTALASSDEKTRSCAMRGIRNLLSETHSQAVMLPIVKASGIINTVINLKQNAQKGSTEKYATYEVLGYYANDKEIEIPVSEEEEEEEEEDDDDFDLDDDEEEEENENDASKDD